MIRPDPHGIRVEWRERDHHFKLFINAFASGTRIIPAMRHEDQARYLRNKLRSCAFRSASFSNRSTARLNARKVRKVFHLSLYTVSSRVFRVSLLAKFADSPLRETNSAGTSRSSDKSSIIFDHLARHAAVDTILSGEGIVRTRANRFTIPART